MPAKKKEASFAEKIRKALTFFNPGATLIERKVTPALKKAKKSVKK